MAGAVAFVALRLDSTPLLVLGLALTAGIAIGALTRHRLGTAFAAFLTTFGPWGFFYVVGVVYAGLAFWLVRAGRQEADDRRGPRR